MRTSLSKPRALREAGEPNQLFPPESGPDIPSLPQCVGVEIEASPAEVTRKNRETFVTKSAKIFGPRSRLSRWPAPSI